MKKFISLSLVICLLACLFAGCGDKGTDWEYIKDKKTLVIGITLYEPMNYYDADGKLIGFDTEFAEAVCKKLGVEPKFQIIEWEQKETELKSKTIDCIWNGLTVSEDRKENMAFSTSYVTNRQVVVIKSANASKYTDTASLAGVTVSAENGSAGQTAIEIDPVLSKNTLIKSAAQKDVLLELKAGTIEAGVIDFIMADSVIKPGTDYSDLMIVEGIDLTPEEYAIGVRLEDKDTLKKINSAIDELVEDGTIFDIAKKYDLTDKLTFKK